MAQEEFKHIIRIVNTDLKGDKPIYMALQKIKGIGFMFSNAICKITGISKEVKAGSLTDAQIEKIDSVIKNPLSYFNDICCNFSINRNHYRKAFSYKSSNLINNLSCLFIPCNKLYNSTVNIL